MMNNAVLYIIILWRMNLFFIKIQKFSAKWVLGLGRTPVWNEQHLGSCETRFLFFNDFQILHIGFNTIKELSKFVIIKNNLQLCGKIEVLCAFLSSKFLFLQNLNLLSDFNEILYETFIWILVENVDKMKHHHHRRTIASSCTAFLLK